MRQLLREIQSGQFAKEWIAEHESGRPNFTRLMQQDDQHQIEQVGRQLRAMMPWIGNQRQETRDRRQGKTKAPKSAVGAKARRAKLARSRS